MNILHALNFFIPVNIWGVQILWVLDFYMSFYSVGFVPENCENGLQSTAEIILSSEHDFRSVIYQQLKPPKM